ncbi:hypothetical protein [Sphingomonas sp. CFBP 13706]|uniref:hypothetical protein n=1 Tax=Sphingomonas sp. CFBP 13706 TaxID=2775314 RepID=UPI00177E1BBC|nr:hypothetical protein [Sphingomonas sp. CFBP 13706]MBD8734583.1 hypothetical protein [Sphingomonas sp. CFBP 13706]
MSIQWRRALLIVPAGLALAPPAVAQEAGQTSDAASQQSTPPAPAGTVRGLEPLQARDTGTAAVPVPDTPRLVLPAPTTAEAPTRSRTPARAPATRSADPDTPRAARVDAATASRRATEAVPSVAPRDAADSRVDSAPASTVTPVATTPAPAVPATTASPEVAPAVAPSSASNERTIAAPQQGRAMPFWLWLAVIPIVVIALWLLRRGPRKRHDRLDYHEPEPLIDAEAPPARPLPTPAPVPPSPARVVTPTPAIVPPSAPEPATSATPQFLDRRAREPERARLSVELRPLRAGLNLLSATAECELVVTNVGAGVAEAIRVQAVLLSAHAGQDADLTAVNAGQVARPATAPFTLAPGESRTIRTVSAMSREAIHSMTAADRPMFVPIVAVNIRYASGAIAGQTARAWAIGVERVDSAKLAPFWLDIPARMYDGIAARPHAPAIEV